MLPTTEIPRAGSLLSSLQALTAVPPLSLVEEVSLAEAYARGREAAARLGGCGESPDDRRVDRGDDAFVERELRATVERGLRARTRLILANVRLVVALARRHESPGVVMGDLVQEGVVGLIAAVERFDPARGVRLGSYATAWIRRHIATAASSRRLVRLPPRAEVDVLACRAAIDAVVSAGGAPPSVEEVAAVVGLEASTVELLLAADRPPVPLETLAHEMAHPAAGDTVTGDRDVRAEADLRQALAQLPAEELDVLRRRYGLDGQGPRSSAVVGQEIGRPKAWVRACERRALRMLRSHPALARACA